MAFFRRAVLLRSAVILSRLMSSGATMRTHSRAGDFRLCLKTEGIRHMLIFVLLRVRTFSELLGFMIYFTDIPLVQSQYY